MLDGQDVSSFAIIHSLSSHPTTTNDCFSDETWNNTQTKRNQHFTYPWTTHTITHNHKRYKLTCIWIKNFNSMFGDVWCHVGMVAQLHGSGEKEAAVVLFWSYTSSAIFLTIWIVIFLSIIWVNRYLNFLEVLHGLFVMHINTPTKYTLQLTSSFEEHNSPCIEMFAPTLVHAFKYMWMLFHSLLMFSNFYRLDLHNEHCVPLWNLQVSPHLIMVIMKVHVYRFRISWNT